MLQGRLSVGIEGANIAAANIAGLHEGADSTEEENERKFEASHKILDDKCTMEPEPA